MNTSFHYLLDQRLLVNGRTQWVAACRGSGSMLPQGVRIERGQTQTTLSLVIQKLKLSAIQYLFTFLVDYIFVCIDIAKALAEYHEN